MIKLADIILEQEDSTKFPEMDNLGAQMAKAVEAELEKEKENIDEAAGMVGIVGLILLSNTVANMLAKMAKFLAKKFNSPKMQSSAEWWEHFTHHNEHAFMAPINRVVSLFVKDKKKREGVTKILYAILIFAMAGSAGGEAIALLRKTRWAQAGLYGVKALVKGVEVNNLIKHAAEDLAA